jgi:hypothetical protein
MDVRLPSAEPVPALAPQKRPSGHHSRRRRLRTSIFNRRLDQALAEGRDPATDGLLACRAAQLTGAKARVRLARGLRDALDRAINAGGISSAIPVATASIRANEDLLLTLADCLDSSRPVSVRGVAAVELLLADGASPLYVKADPHVLEDAAEVALIGLGAR